MTSSPPGTTALAALRRTWARSKRTVECRNCAEARSKLPVGKAVRQVVVLKVDAVLHTSRPGFCAGACQRGLGDVDRYHLPAVLGQPDGVAALAAAEVERPAG